MRAVARLRHAGALALALTPLAMAIANRSSPVFVGCAALAFLAAALIEDRRAAWAEIVAPLTSPPGVAALAFLGWCLLSFAWSPLPATSWRAASEFAPALAAAYLLARLAPGRMPDWAPRLAASALGIACLYIVADLVSDLWVQRALGLKLAYFIFNRPALTILLIAGPLALTLHRRGRRIAALAILAVSAAAILRSVSGAAAMGLGAGAALAAFAWIAPKRASLGLAGAALCLATILAPVEGDLLHRAMPEAAHERLVQSSSRVRVAIARAFGAAVAADPWIGAGYGVSARFAETPGAARLDPELAPMLEVGHPHNSFLQVWVELGLIGAALALAALLLTLRGLAELPKASVATALGLVAAASAVAFVEHGAWQAWWVAGLGAAIAWLREGAPQAAAASTRLRPAAFAR